MFGRKQRLTVLCAALLVFGAFGCSGGPKIPSTFAVKGKVLYKDQPLADAEIGFVSKLDNKDVLPARGVTNANGEFTLATYIDPQHEVSGATPGEYVVTVTKNEKMDDAELMNKFMENPAMEFKKLVPTQYTDATASPLTATVKSDGDNSFEFKLVD